MAEPRHQSDEVMTKLDRLQSELSEGPCITALTDAPEDGLIVAHDLDGDDEARWPRFGPYAVAEGYRSLLSVQLSTDRGPRAAVNLYSSAPHVFDADARQTAGLFGVQASMLLYGRSGQRR